MTMVRTIDELKAIHLMKVGGVQTRGQCFINMCEISSRRAKSEGMAIAQYQMKQCSVYSVISVPNHEEVVRL